MTDRRFLKLRALVPAILAASLLTLVLGVGQASAHQLQTFELVNSFSTGIQYGEYPWDIAADEETGYIYAVDHGGNLYKFDENGNPAPFTAPEFAGSNKLTPQPYNDTTSPGGKVVVDNSGTATQGRIYLLDGNFNMIHLYEPSGKEITTGKWPLNVEDIVPSQFNPGDIAVDGEGHLWDEEEAGFSFVREFDQEGENTYVRMGRSGQAFALDSQNNEYIGSEYGYFGNGIGKYTTAGDLLFMLPPSQALSSDVSTDELYALTPNFGERYYVNQYLPNGTRVAHIKAAAEGSQLQSITYNHTNGRMYVGYYGKINILEHGPTVTVPDVVSEAASNFQPTSIEAHGSVNPDGVATKTCKFFWGSNAFNLTESVPCDQGEVLSGSTTEALTATIPGLTFGETYYYQLQVENADGEELGREIKFVTSESPTAEKTYIGEVHSDSGVVHATILPGGADTTVHVEYGPAPCSANACSDSEHVTVPAGTKPHKVAVKIAGLKDGATYYYRLVAENQSGSYTGGDKFFTTFPYESVEDPCANAHVRQQTGAARLLDCRAYELVSAANASGYDVESDLSPGQEPMSGYPVATDKALYAIHSGAISGVGSPVNRGPDPYVATRGAQEWTTEYVGIPSENAYATESFASTLLEADPALDTFAFGGPELCSPCFEDGSTNLPLRLPNKKLVEGMVGSEGGAAEPSGYIGKSFSADGQHLVFGTTEKLEPTGNEGGSDTTIYERDLKTGTTQVVSTLPDESTIANGPDVGELDVSADGSRVVVGELVSTDSAGNRYWHLYMHIGTGAKSIDLTPGATHGVLFDGMSADGTKVYFTTEDALTTPANQDTDTSADIYLAEVGSASATLSRVSYGPSAGNTDSCEPPAGWNSVEGGKNCDVVAIAGGGGVASESGTIYFISPEKLDTSSGASQPVQDQANLYEAAPGSAPSFVATVDSSIGKPPPPPPKHKEANPEFATNPSSVWASMAVDQQTGDLYALDDETGNVHRWKSNGEPDDFGATGNNEIHVGETYCCTEYEIAVDGSTGPFSGYLYFATNTEEVRAFNPEGEEKGALSELGEACGVSVDDSTGDVYVGTFGDTISRFEPKSGAGPSVSNSSYEPKTGMTAPGASLCNVDVSTDGHVYLWPYTGGEVTQYNTDEFSGSFPILGGKQLGPGINAQSDPETGLVYVLSHEGEVIDVYTPEGTHIEEFTGNEMYFAHSLAVDAKDGRVYSGMYERIIEFEGEEVAYEPIDNPLVRHGVLQSGVHSYKDFQVTPSGRYAAFATRQPIDSSYDNELHYEVYRYDGQEGALACVSCNPSNAVAEGDAGLASKGLSLTDDGTVFFNSTDALVARDLDSKQDAYEYENGELQLLSTGVSPFASSMLGATANGKDAFFFTRDTLVPQDENGSLVKLYDARADGGYPYVPPEVPCKASDECHGRGTEAPPSPEINTLHGGTGNVGATTKPKQPNCKKNQVRKHGKCVKRHRNKRRHARSRHHRHG